MGEQRTRFPSTSEDVYKVRSDMSMLCYFILWRGDAVVKGTKGQEREETRATAPDLNFLHRYLFLRKTHYLMATLSGIFLSHSRVSPRVGPPL